MERVLQHQVFVGLPHLFNLGKKKHPANCLNEKGGCKFNHVCDAYVGDKGPGGRCGSDKHARHNCDNPAKQPTEQK